MSHLSPSRPAWRAALALASCLAASCGGGSKPDPAPDLPQVSLTAPLSNVAGTSLKVIVTVAGCESVKTLSLYDRETRLKDFTYAGGSQTLELDRKEVPYTSGIAASLALHAQVECADGRKNTSQPQAVTFFPVAKVVSDTAGGQVVTDYFVVESSGNSATFVGCGNPSTGTGTMYRVNTSGAVVNQVQMSTGCTPETVISENVNGRRWVWTPGQNAFALDMSNFTITAKTPPDYLVAMLSVLPNGDAVVVNNGGLVQRFKADSGGSVATKQWEYNPEGNLIAAPLARADGTLLMATEVISGTVGQARLIVDKVNAESGGSSKVYEIRTIFSEADEPPAPAASFSSDGSVLYLGFSLANNQGQVVACATEANGCEGITARWTSPVLATNISAVVPYAGGSRIAAVGPQKMYSLDAGGGAIRNKDSKTIDAKGELRVLQVQPGAGASSDFYLLNGPARGLGQPPTFPVEIVGIDQPAGGDSRELFRYEVATSLGAGVDEAGTLWIRLGNNLVQALSSNEYRRSRP